MTDQQKSDREKAKQAWKEHANKRFDDIHEGINGAIKGQFQLTGIKDFKSSLKRDIEKRIAEHRKYYNLFNRREEDAHIQELQYIIELIETVEP